jgi:tetratricopeptide (TPR) repeat protein
MQHLFHNVSSMAAGFLVLLLPAFTPAATSPQSFIDQAAKLIRHARDTQDPADFRQAGAVAEKALAADPQNFDAQRFEAMALLGQQDPAAAVDVASKLNKRLPDDIGIWALLSEINAARGDYAEAERCAQWVLDLRRNSPLGFSTAARLREVFGDYEGAAEFYFEALHRTSQADTEERSWLMVQSARMQLLLNNQAGAAATLDQAEKLFPDSLQVLEQKAELARRKGDFADAASLLSKLSQQSPTLAHLYADGEALDRAGMHDEANAIYERLHSDSHRTDSVLVLYYADRGKNPEKALALATQQIATRQDIATLDAYAWALYRADKLSEARTAIDKLLAVGTRDPQYVCHAAQIRDGSCETIP